VKRRIVLGVALLVLVSGGFTYTRLRAMASVGAGYVAKEVCSCVFVGGRSFDSCRADVPESMDRVQAEQRTDGVYAFVTGLASRVALFEPGFGCTLH
jgi:hypothetical protein